MLGRPVVRPAITETTALGACYAAGLAVGYFRNIEELRTQWAIDREWRPQMDDGLRASLYRSWKKAVTRSFDWVDDPS